MVVFTCGHCGESVNKPKVEKHYLTKCRNRSPNLSCMDCFKDFFGKEYEEHTKCITEEQRYSAKGFVAKEKKGELKQNAWVEMVQSVLDEQKNAPASVLRILNTVSKHNNTPRKKPKFINFVKNVCGHKTAPKDIDAAWDMIAGKVAALSINNQNRNQKQNDEKPSEIEENNTNDDSQTIPEEAEVSSTSDSKLPEVVETEENQEGDGKKGKKSKKQRKEEKKQKKYEAELESAAQAPEEEEEEEVKTKKGKKKNKSENVNGDANGVEDNKNKKRKRQDTVNSTASVENDVADLQMQNLQLNVEKTKKKKPKVEEEEELEESMCLHDQNVAYSEEQGRAEKFNWHACIMSVLQKKGNEVQFKRLQKKVLGEYAEVTGRDVDDRIADKFIKKLRSTPNVRVDKNRVVLVQ
ncbi:cell growth-regulating nucleolar protein [Plutella xylostella]|uniref:cell growth-regulating nucleolar protein n=1 Tax=Plutella xylostella TaxID=51655 RepID=UPI002032357D|nr:cell growth-regulating nucleolar protein [Plutella xylostella]